MGISPDRSQDVCDSRRLNSRVKLRGALTLSDIIPSPPTPSTHKQCRGHMAPPPLFLADPQVTDNNEGLVYLMFFVGLSFQLK
mmetsp:Transcript_4950/g.8620  ORF Transcript_4950/g.8620 Transcript_4950/m.8620 type:complete len:83 (-) Transcript_4950:318-566(-)